MSVSEWISVLVEYAITEGDNELELYDAHGVPMDKSYFIEVE